jgi:phage tail sheath protein FI
VTVPAVPRTPGVDVEWLTVGPVVPAAVRTDVAGFLGIAQRGPAHNPVRITSWSLFESVFGGYDQSGWLAFAVNGFFANGGNACWVVRVLDPATTSAATATLPTGAGAAALTATATSDGSWANGARLTTVDLGGNTFWLSVDSPATQEVWAGLSLDPTSPAYFASVVNDPARGSAVVNLAQPAHGGLATTVGSGAVTLSGGNDGRAPRLENYAPLSGTAQGLATLGAVDEVGLVTIPDAVRLSAGDLTSLYNALLVDCAARRRFALLDQPSPACSPQQALNWVITLQASSTAAAFGSVGYPWILAQDPFGTAGDVLPVPASGSLAGVYARTDLTTGVYKAPANATLVGARDVAWPVDPATHALLNARSVNVITARPGRGIRLMGARTLDSSAAGPWRYVNVRRLVSMIELSLLAALSWLVFEPNSPAIQAEVEREVRAFLLTLWEAGALDGAQASNAMSVQCDSSTTTAADEAAGRLICLIGVQPPIPAEFVTVRIALSEAGVQVTGEQGRTALPGPTVLAAKGVPSAQ